MTAMFDKILDATQGELTHKLTNELSVSPNQVGQVLGIAKEDVQEVFNSSLVSGNFSTLTNIFSTSSTFLENPTVKNIINKYAGDLMTNFGFSTEQSHAVANVTIPSILAKVKELVPAEGFNHDNVSNLIGIDEEGFLDRIENGISDFFGRHA